MKVLHVNGGVVARGGVEVYLSSLLPLLEERGVQTAVAHDEADEDGAALPDRVPGMNSPDFRRESQVQRDLERILEKHAPEIVHIHNVENVGILRAALAYGPTVISTHDFRSICPANMFYWKRTQQICHRAGAGPACFTTSLRHRCVSLRPKYGAYHYHRSRSYIRFADHVAAFVSPSARAQERLVAAGVDKRTVHVLPYFCPIVPRHEPRPRPEVDTITFIGRMAANKGYEYFSEALGMLPDSVRGIVVGNMNPETEAHIHKLAREHGCEGRLELRKWANREQVTEILEATSVFVFPSIWEETLGIVGLESLSRGTPVVASDVGGVREWLKDGINGYLVEPKSSVEIRDAVSRVLALDDAPFLEMGRRAIETVKKKFMPSHHLAGLLRIYESVTA